MLIIAESRGPASAATAPTPARNGRNAANVSPTQNSAGPRFFAVPVPTTRKFQPGAGTGIAMCPSPAGQQTSSATACSPSAPHSSHGDRPIASHPAVASRSSTVNGQRATAAHRTSRGARETHSRASNRNRLNFSFSVNVSSVTDCCKTHRQPGRNSVATTAGNPQNSRGGR